MARWFSRFHPRQGKRSLISFAKRVGDTLHGPHFQVRIGLRFQRQGHGAVLNLDLQVEHALFVAAIQAVGDPQQRRQQW